MYTQAGGRPGAGRGGKGRYMKGRLPQGVDFKAYPGRSSTPLPTAESKSAERINQLKIWNEAATNDDKRRLHTAQSKQALTNAGSANRRTDSFKDARDRHSASFQPESTMSKETPAAPVRDIFADRSGSESEEDRPSETSTGGEMCRNTSDSAKPAHSIAAPTARVLTESSPTTQPPPHPVSIPGVDQRIEMSSERPAVSKDGKGCCSVQ